MSSKNLKKVVQKIYKNAKEENLAKRTFRVNDYPTNLMKAITYINNKSARLAFNDIFKPLFKAMVEKDINEYVAMGHKLTWPLKKGIIEYAKEKAKTETKAKLAAKAPAQQSLKEQENVLTEG